MDTLTILLIVVGVIVVAGLAFAAIRKRQRSGSVLAAPPARSGKDVTR